MKIRIFTFIVLFFAFSSCTKEANVKRCWYLVQADGTIRQQQVCNKSQTQMENEYGAQFDFFPASDPWLCWKVTRNSTVSYIKNSPEFWMQKFISPTGASFQTLPCNSFCNWRLEIRGQSKITGNYSTVTVRNEVFFTASTDTCSKIFVGKVVVLRETADSIVTGTYTSGG